MTEQFIYPLRTHIEDTDCTGIVYHGSYINFIERARSEWLDSLGLGIEWQRQQHIYFLVHSLTIEYLKPLRVHEYVEVISSVKTIGHASVVCEQYLRMKNSPDKILCKAEVKLACVNENMRPTAIPETPVFQTLRRLVT